MISVLIIFLLLLLFLALSYKKNNRIFILESAKIYHNKILPYLNKNYKQNTKWVFDILENRAPHQTIYSRTAKFVVCKDAKWKSNQLKDLYLLAFPDEKIMTIRDLRQKHIPLLESKIGRAHV